MIQAQSLTKRYGSKTAVDSVDFVVQPGKVTGFLGPNGAGKSTTMRMIVGLDRPTSGSVIVNGKPYAEHKAPLREVGVLLDAKAVHTGRSAYSHLRAMAATHNIPSSRVNEVIALTGLEPVARKRVGGFSLGMGQRLGIAAALLGDPATLILDEPVNGLDPEGVQWVRRLTRQLAAEGRTVLLSSHLMSEMALTADHIILLGRGRVIADAPVADIISSSTRSTVRVRTPNSAALASLLAQPDVTVANLEQDLLEIVGVTAAEIGNQAAAAGIVLHELTPVSASLEEAYMSLTQDELEYRTGGTAADKPEPTEPELQEAAR
ncbi:multidrug ABC transporter ATP-binding protein [Cryobacterium roopkundense]|uniref:ABC-2 type transport system ATP-binding protein n=1 Tax=Cryobacterium roopkundense TaxID=1001240 RepID=A0A099J084_9MICO|nr:ATP-binding cassette domain-containing protein [Cryobacterium roopkundense]KGJ71626.1 multidrug ABC transporter ATP-binding protein [Cryobacterium roopkundense]MBB5642812.1 ABC-2 type transport system ATP-binding protein [Cryobacterium roopkundense]